MSALEEAPEADRRGGARHPRFAPTLIGQEAALSALSTAFAGGRPHHAWLIAGPEGVGKATLAWRMARALVAGEAEGATRQRIDRLIDQLAHPDLMLLRRNFLEEKKRFAADITVDDVRRLKDRMFAASGGRRVAIVDSVDDMNANAANALLKLLEEPPARAVFFLVSHRPGGLLPTIRSRCRLLRLPPLTTDDLAAVLRRTDAADDADGLAKAGEGSAAVALALANDAARKVRAATEALLAGLPRIDPARWLPLAAQIGRRDAEAFAVFARAFAEHAARRARSASSPSEAAAFAACWSEGEAIAEAAAAYNLDAAAAALRMVSALAAALGERALPAARGP